MGKTLCRDAAGFSNPDRLAVKFMFSKKATKIDKIFTLDLTLCSKCQIEGEDFVDFFAFLKNTNFNLEGIICPGVN